MADHADVRSLERLEAFHERCIHFRVQLLKEVENLQTELRRLTQWIDGEATNYWQEQLTGAGRRLVECQDALVRCMSYVREDERRPCSEEKKRVRRAQQRRTLCEQQLKTMRAASGAWEREITKANTKLQRCRDLSESDLLVAINHLAGQIERLREYASLKSPALSSTNKLATSGGEPPADSPAPEVASEVQQAGSQAQDHPRGGSDAKD